MKQLADSKASVKVVKCHTNIIFLKPFKLHVALVLYLIYVTPYLVSKALQLMSPMKIFSCASQKAQETARNPLLRLIETAVVEDKYSVIQVINLDKNTYFNRLSVGCSSNTFVTQ